MGASKARTLLLALLLTLLAASSTRAARAQLWRGPAAIEVRAENQGKPAAGGEVRLEFLDMEPPAGPAPVKLDGRGRAVVGSLAEGRWRVEVSREGAMTYRAEVLVRRDGKPDVIEAVQHNVPGAVSMMEVKLARARGGPAPPPSQAPTPAAPSETTEVEPLEPLRPASEPERPMTTEPAAPAPSIPSTPPQQVPVSAAEPLRPPPSTDTPAAPPVVPTPKPAPPTRPAPAPSTPQPVPAPVPTPEPERPAPARPVAPPDRSTPPLPAQTPPVAAPPAAPPPAGPVLKRTFQDRTCVECRPGESSLSMEVLASPSAAGCGDGLRDTLARLDTAGMGEGCHLVRIDLPRNARFVGYRYEVQDRGGQSSDCLAGKDCPAGGRWPVDPVLRRDGAGTTTVATAFENRGDRERRAVLTVYFKEGGGADAPRPMMPSKAKKSPPGA
jgi:hypothetical protein